MLVPVWGGSTNFLLTMRGRLGDLSHSYPLMFIFVGVIGYVVGSTQGTFEAFRSLQEVWHLTNFVGRPFALDDVRLCQFRDLGRGVRAAAAGDRQGTRPARAEPAFLDGLGGQLHLRDFAFDRRHHPGPGLDARCAVHPVGGGHSGLLGVGVAWAAC